MEKQTVGDGLDDDLNGENGSEEVEVAIARRFSVQRVFSGQHARGDHNSNQDDVGENSVIAHCVEEVPVWRKGQEEKEMRVEEDTRSSINNNKKKPQQQQNQ